MDSWGLQMLGPLLGFTFLYTPYSTDQTVPSFHNPKPCIPGLQHPHPAPAKRAGHRGSTPGGYGCMASDGWGTRCQECIPSTSTLESTI